MRRWNTSDDGWCVLEVGCDPSREATVAKVLAVANGSIGVRGWLEERGADCGPGTFFAGLFIPSDERSSDALPTIAAAPSWFTLRFALDGEQLDTLSVERTLDLRRGLVLRRNPLIPRVRSSMQC